MLRRTACIHFLCAPRAIAPIRPRPCFLCARDSIAHAMLPMLAALADLDGTKAGELYDRLKAVYNLYLPPGSQSIPPVEEWQGMSSICESFNGRCVAVSNFQLVFDLEL